MTDATTVLLPDGDQMPKLGIGTWRMGERVGDRDREIAALRYALDLGVKLIDTAEMYGEGGAERVIGMALGARRDNVFLVSKVYPQNASRKGVVEACERSLTRLETDRIDLYLLHWRGRYPLVETIEGFEALRAAGKIRHWGVSNFGPSDMAELMGAPGGRAVATNQVLYNLGRRGIEYDLLPWQRERNLPTMAYTPLEPLQRQPHGALQTISRRHGVSPAQVAIAWVLRQPDVVAIPKAVSLAHIRDNRAALDLTLDSDDLAQLDAAFPPPTRATPLAVL
jgi:diketogulonate reductase-like aldo/keto reductase